MKKLTVNDLIELLKTEQHADFNLLACYFAHYRNQYTKKELSSIISALILYLKLLDINYNNEKMMMCLNACKND